MLAAVLTWRGVSEEALPQLQQAGRPQRQRFLHQQPGRVPEQAGDLQGGREEEEEEEHRVKQKWKKLFKENVFILGYESENRSSACSPGSGLYSDISYAADAFVFDVQELLLCELHVQEVLEHQPIPEHGTLQGQQIML